MQKKYKKIVGDEVDRINFIVKQLLEFSKPSELSPKETNVNELLDTTLDFLNNEFLKNNIKVQKNYTTLPLIKIDPLQMKQVFLNLLLNAIDSIEKGGNITISTFLDKDNILVKIRDNGIGRAAAEKYRDNHSGQGILMMKQYFRQFNEATGRKAHFRVKDLFENDVKPSGTVVEITIL